MADATASKKKRGAQSRAKRAHGGAESNPTAEHLPQDSLDRQPRRPEPGEHLDLINDTDGSWAHAEEEAMAALDETAQAEPKAATQGASEMPDGNAGNSPGAQIIAAGTGCGGGAGDVDWSSLALEGRGRRAYDLEIASFLRFTGGRFPSLLQPGPPDTQEDDEGEPGATD
jgi:hypothetical protein